MADERLGFSRVATPDRVIDVEVGFDERSKVYFVLSSQLVGLHVETPTFEEFVEVVLEVAPDLLEAHEKSTRFNFCRAVDLVPANGR